MERSHLKLCACLGKGSFGAVMSCISLDGERYACKMMPFEKRRQPATGGRLRRGRFRIDSLQREIEIMKSCRSPYITSYVASFVHREQLWLVMELVEGGSLDIILRHHGALPEAACAIIAADVLRALAYMHGQGIAHFDVKPGNMLMTLQGRCKMCDFGVARRMVDVCELVVVDGSDEEDGSDEGEAGHRDSGQHGHGGESPLFPSHTKARSAPHSVAASATSPTSATATPTTRKSPILGTTVYCSPEMLQQQGAGYKSDVWSLGVSVVEMATGRQPFTGMSRVRAIQIILRGSPPSLPGSFSPAFRKHINEYFTLDAVHRPSAAQLLQAAVMQEAKPNKKWASVVRGLSEGIMDDSASASDSDIGNESSDDYEDTAEAWDFSV